MKIAFIPIDNRPVCYNLAKDITAIDKDLEIFLPPREFLGDLKKSADTEALFKWLKDLPRTDCMIISLDTIAYGGLIPSRRGGESLNEVKSRIERIKPYLEGKKVHAFSSIMRIPNNNYNDEEKEYWKDYGKKIFEYSYNLHKLGKAETDVPKNILEDYLGTRKRNFEINKLYLQWQKEGLFETLIFSKDDCAEFGLNVKEAQELEKLGGKTKTGADEIPLTLLARAIKKKIKVHPVFAEPDFKHCISNYEDVSIEKSVLSQLELGGFDISDSENADIILYVNNFVEKQGELVMGWDTKPFDSEFTPPDKFFAIADVRFANGADNYFVEAILPYINSDNFYGYSAWNTSANTLGSLLAGIKTAFKTEKYDREAFLNLQKIRLLDDWAYQANVRAKISSPCDIKSLMRPYEERISEALDSKCEADYIYPWNRKFEIEVVL